MKRTTFILIFCCFAYIVSVAQNTKGLRKNESQQQFNGLTSREMVLLDDEWKIAQRVYGAKRELYHAEIALESAQRKLNDLIADQQAKKEKFDKKVAKITDPAKRDSEQKKFEEKMQKQAVKIQKQYDEAQLRVLRAQENLDRALVEESMNRR